MENDKQVMARYLSDYIAHELEAGRTLEEAASPCCLLDALNAFEGTHGVVIGCMM